MSIRNVNNRQLGLVCRYSLRHSLRGGAGLVFLVLAIFFGLSVANVIVLPFETLLAQNEDLGLDVSPRDIEQNLVNLARPAVEWAIAPAEVDDPEAQRAAEEETRRWVDYVLEERPALLSAIFFILIFGTPLLVCFGAFNQTSGDIGNRGLRYLLLRTERANIFYGRLLATVLLTIAVQAIVVVTIALYLAIKVQVYEASAIASWSLHGLMALSVVSLPYVAVCAWLSASLDTAMSSLVMCNVVIGGVLLAAVLAQLAWDPAYSLIYLLPWGIQNNLLAPGASTVWLTIAGCLVYTAVFVWLGARKFETRDL